MTADQPAARHRGGKPRQVVLYVHLSDAAVPDPRLGELGRLENTRGPVTAEQVRKWCGNPDAQVTVNPVIDLNEHIDVEAYEIRGRMAGTAILTHPTCVFPWCTRPARRADRDHTSRTTPGHGRPTCSCNPAPLCRRHHRPKTHGGWTYTAARTGDLRVDSPHGYQYLRDHHGTLDVSRTDTPHPPDLHPPPGRLTSPPHTPPDHHRRGHRGVRNSPPADVRTCQHAAMSVTAPLAPARRAVGSGVLLPGPGFHQPDHAAAPHSPGPLGPRRRSRSPRCC